MVNRREAFGRLVSGLRPHQLDLLAKALDTGRGVFLIPEFGINLSGKVLSRAEPVNVTVQRRAQRIRDFNVKNNNGVSTNEKDSQVFNQ